MVQAIMESIRYNEDGAFPREELQQLLDHREEAIPYLLQLIKEAIEQPEQHLQDHMRMDHTYAIYLLAQFRETRLYPLLIDLLNFPSDNLGSLVGEVLAEDGGRLLSSVYGGDIDPIHHLIQNEGIDEYTRGQGLNTLVILALHGQLERTGVVDFIRSMLLKASEEDLTFNSMLVDAAATLHGDEAYAAIKQAYENDMIDNGFIDLETLEHVLQKPLENVLESNRTNSSYSYIEDIIDELSCWGCFEQEDEMGGQPARWGSLPVQQPVRVEKIGRNEPCPCGSGKKYKKCCAG